MSKQCEELMKSIEEAIHDENLSAKQLKRRDVTVIQTKEDDEIGAENIDCQSSHDYKFSEVLIKMDKNTVKYMIEEQQRELEQLEQKHQELEQKRQELEQKD